MDLVYRVIELGGGQAMNRFITLVEACVLWVKYPEERRVEELISGTNDVVRRVPRTECCSTLREWFRQNRFLSESERADLAVLIEEACRSR